MSFDRRSYPSIHRLGLALSAAVLLGSAAHLAHAAQTTPPNEPADVCPALRHIVEASDYKQLHTQYRWLTITWIFYFKATLSNYFYQ